MVPYGILLWSHAAVINLLFEFDCGRGLIYQFVSINYISFCRKLISSILHFKIIMMINVKITKLFCNRCRDVSKKPKTHKGAMWSFKKVPT